MEIRLGKVNISSAGGTAGEGSRTCKITLPTSWITQMGIAEDYRQMELVFDGEKIVISRFVLAEEFAEKKRKIGHKVCILRYYDADELCSLIYADFTDETLRVENYTDEFIKTAFGKKEMPSWEEFMFFLEERCVPRGRAGLREYLESIGVAEYDPLEIIQKTKGRMAEDQQWLEIEVLA